MTFEIKEISTKKEMKRFARFPLELYKNNLIMFPLWYLMKLKVSWILPACSIAAERSGLPVTGTTRL